MTSKTPDQPSSREKIASALAENKDLVVRSDSTQTVSDKMVALGTNMLPVSEDSRLIALADTPNPGLDASSHGHDPKTTRISETMNHDVVFCHGEDHCADALKKMDERDLSHLPVVDHEMRIVGLVAREDLRDRITNAAAEHVEAGAVIGE